MSTSKSLAEELPDAIAKVSELIGSMNAQGNELNAVCPGAGDGTHMVMKLLRVKRDVAVAAMQSGDVVAMLTAYLQLAPALKLTTEDAPPADADFPKPGRKDGGTPCGECHLSPGEVCDICGAIEPRRSSDFSPK